MMIGHISAARGCKSENRGRCLRACWLSRRSRGQSCCSPNGRLLAVQSLRSVLRLGAKFGKLPPISARAGRIKPKATQVNAKAAKSVIARRRPCGLH